MSTRKNAQLSLPKPVVTTDVTASIKRKTYLRRLMKFDQMDFEFALWQFYYLFVSPQKIYRNFRHRKLVKTQYARDDPAFLVLFIFVLFLTSFGFALVFQLSFSKFLMLSIYAIVFDLLGSGIITATIFWYISNKYWRKQDEICNLEWGYAFDIHMNSLFPSLSLLNISSVLFYYWFFKYDSILCILTGNTVWFFSVLYYVYLTFLGYESMEFLKGAEKILYGFIICFVLYILSVLYKFNAVRNLILFYEWRIGGF